MTIRIKEQTIDLTGLTDMALRKDCCGAVWLTLTLSFQNRRPLQFMSPEDASEQELLEIFRNLQLPD